jgi:hypothetical protein
MNMTIAGKRYRIKSRGRFITFLVFVILVTVTFASTIMGFNSADGITEREYFEITVEHGDTLWQLARQHMPYNTDIRRAVHTLSTLNNISAHELQAGQTLIIPI